MNMKLTYDYVKIFIESKGYQLLSDSYINSHTKLYVKCPIGHEYKVKFNNFQQGQRCPFCASNIKYTYNYVKEYIEKEDYQLLSKEYKNINTKLLLKCPIGHEYDVNFKNFKQGTRCSYCTGNKKYTYNYVKNY